MSNEVSIQPSRPIDQSQTLTSFQFRRELAELINKWSLEKGSNTADFVIAEYLANCLAAYDRAAYVAWCAATTRGHN